VQERLLDEVGCPEVAAELRRQDRSGEALQVGALGLQRAAQGGAVAPPGGFDPPRGPSGSGGLARYGRRAHGSCLRRHALFRRAERPDAVLGSLAFRDDTEARRLQSSMWWPAPSFGRWLVASSGAEDRKFTMGNAS